MWQCILYLSPYFPPLHVFIPILESTPTSTPPHAACWRTATSSTTSQSWTGSEQPYRKCTRRSRTDGQIPTYHLPFFLHIGFVSTVNNLTLHWCTWDHAACMCIGTPRWSTSGLMGMYLCAVVELGYLPHILAFIQYMSYCIVVLV